MAAPVIEVAAAAPIALGILGWILRRAFGEAKWRAVRALALRLLGDDKRPDVTDPQRAVVEALITLQLERLAREASKVSRAFDALNGATKLPDKVP